MGPFLSFRKDEIFTRGRLDSSKRYEELTNIRAKENYEGSCNSNLYLIPNFSMGGWDGMRWDGMGWDGMRWDEMG